MVVKMLRIYEAQPSVFLPQYQRQRMFLRSEKGVAWHIDASSVVWTVIYNGKLANQVSRLIVIVVKHHLDETIVSRGGINTTTMVNYDRYFTQLIKTNMLFWRE